MNLSPGGLEDGPPGFPYFDGKFEFGYGGPPFHPHDAPFFPGHHPGNGGPGQGMPFGQGGRFHGFSSKEVIIRGDVLYSIILSSGVVCE